MKKINYEKKDWNNVDNVDYEQGGKNSEDKNTCDQEDLRWYSMQYTVLKQIPKYQDKWTTIPKKN